MSPNVPPALSLDTAPYDAACGALALAYAARPDPSALRARAEEAAQRVRNFACDRDSLMGDVEAAERTLGLSTDHDEAALRHGELSNVRAELEAVTIRLKSAARDLAAELEAVTEAELAAARNSNERIGAALSALDGATNTLEQSFRAFTTRARAVRWNHRASALADGSMPADFETRIAAELAGDVSLFQPSDADRRAWIAAGTAHRGPIVPAPRPENRRPICPTNESWAENAARPSSYFR